MRDYIYIAIICLVIYIGSCEQKYNPHPQRQCNEQAYQDTIALLMDPAYQVNQINSVDSLRKKAHNSRRK
jgi:hypothetical protein